jgi:hypothetical protein
LLLPNKITYKQPMIKSILAKAQDFRNRLFRLFKFRADATMDLIDAIAGPNHESVVKASLSPLFMRKYSSITDAADNMFRHKAEENPTEQELQEEHLKISRLLAEQCPPPRERGFTLLATDCTAKPRIYSSKVTDRTIVHAPNHVPGQKPITVGHEYSLVVYLSEDERDRNAHWTYPLSIRRVQSHQTGPQVGFEQVQMLVTTTAFQYELCVNVSDAAYSTQHWIVNGDPIPNLINVARLRGNRVLYRQPIPATEKKTRGRPSSYGERFRLNTPSLPDEETRFEKITPSGARWIIHLSRWKNLLIRGDRAKRMGKYPFDVVQAQVFDEAGERVFKNPLWLMVSGRRRCELTSEQAYGSYAQRYDIEHCFRFGKQKLLLARSQTPDTRHEENLTWVTMLSFAMLYQVRRLAVEVKYPWEGRKVTATTKTVSVTQVQRDYTRIIRGIGTPARIPKPRGKSVGRLKGTIVPHRIRCPIIRKRRAVVIRC